MARCSEAAHGLSSTFAAGYNQGKSKSSYSGRWLGGADSVLPVKAIASLALGRPLVNRYGASITATSASRAKAVDPVRQNFPNNGSLTFEEYSGQIRKELHAHSGIQHFRDLTVCRGIQREVLKHLTLAMGVYNLTNRKSIEYAITGR